MQHWPVLSYVTRLRIDCQFYIGTWIIYNAEQWDQTMKHLQKRSSGEIEARKKCLCPQKCGMVVFWVFCSSSVVWHGVCLEIVWKIILVWTRLIPCVAWFLDIKKKETWSSKPSSTARLITNFPQGHTQIRGNSHFIIRIIRKRSFFPIRLMGYCQYQQPIFGRGFTSSGFKNFIRLLVAQHVKPCLCSEWCFAYFFVSEAG